MSKSGKVMSAEQLENPQSYNQEEIQQILRLAIARQTNQEELSREQLWEIGVELGLDVNSLQIAEQDWLNQKAIEQKKQEFNAYRQEEFKQKAIRYLIVNTFLVSINLISSHTISWSIYILLMWGIGLSLHGWRTFQSKGEEYEKAFQSWLFRQELKQGVSTIWERIKKAWQN